MKSVLVFSAFLSIVLGGAENDMRTKLRELLSQGEYDPEMRPGDGLVEVTTTAYVGEIRKTKDSMWVSGYFRQQWSDPRLSWVSSNFSLGDMFNGQVWIPDTFVVAARGNMLATSHPSEARSSSVLFLREGGTVLASMRINVEVPCSGTNCSISWESFGHASDDISYHWREDSPLLTGQFLPEGTAVSNENANVEVGTKTYSSVRIDVVFPKKCHHNKHGHNDSSEESSEENE